MMTKGTAITVIVMAFLVGLVTGQLTSSSGGSADSDAAVAEADTAAVEGIAEDNPVERYKVPVSAAQPSKGAENAPITIIEFSDFECPFCGRVNPTLAQLDKDYPGKIRVVWRNQPLPFHKNAALAAQASLAANAQGKFWEYHDKLFANRKAMTRPDLDKYAEELKLDMVKFKAALDGKTFEPAVKADQALAAQLGVRGTPNFFVNGRNLRGAQPVAKFKELIDDELKRVAALEKKGVPAEKMYATLTAKGLTKAAPPKPKARAGRPNPADTYKVPVSNANPAKGPADALVTIVEFSDYQCPFCSRVEPTIDAVKAKYGKDVRVVWKNNPLPFHKDAPAAHALAMEAFSQRGSKGFWQMHEQLFKNQKALKRADLEGYAKAAGLDMKKVSAALDGKTHKKLIDADQGLAKSLGASGTPAFFINGRFLGGAQPQPNFEKLIDEELAKAKKKVAAGTARAKIYAETIKNGKTKPDAAPAPKRPDPNKLYKIAPAPDAPFKGNPKAKVVIDEFSDFQCPFCGRVNPTIAQVIKEFGDKVKIVWRHYPLPFHKDAPLASEASIEIFKQGGNKKFWAFHDLLFQNQRALKQADLEKYAVQLGGLNMVKFKAALNNRTHKARVEADVAAIKKAGARIGTPSFFINGKLLQGAQPFPSFKSKIEAALAETK